MSLIHADQLRQALIRQQHLLQLEEQRRAIEEPLMQQARDRLAAGWPLVDDDTEDTEDTDDEDDEEETDSQPTDPALLEAEQALRDWDREATTLRAPIPRRGPVEAAYAPSSPGLAPIPESPNERQSTVPASS